LQRHALVRWGRRHSVQVALALPLFGCVLLLTVAPILDTVRLSLTAPVGARFPSLENYRALAGSVVFRRAVANTVVVAFFSILLQLGVGLALALTLHTRFRGRSVVRTVMLVPLGVPTVVAGAVMLLVFARAGYLNTLIFELADAVRHVAGVEWRYAPASWTVAGGWRTLLVIALADTWKVLPLVTIVFLAGLQSIPDEVSEAADVDGAGLWQRFSRIMLPLLLPYVTMAVILRAVDGFRIFELALVLAGRVEPVLGTFIWSRYGPPTDDPFTAAAASMVLFGLIAIFVVLYLRLVALRREAAP
jgi:trehalose transport system permease protein